MCYARLYLPVVLLFAVLTGWSVENRAEQPWLRTTIDQQVLAAYDSKAGTPASPSDDYMFARRVSLDLTGRPISVTALKEFVADSAPLKREQLIDRLLASPEYARHMQYRFDVLLMQRLPKKHIDPAAFAEFLRKSFAENKPFDQLAMEILSADGADESTRSASRFMLDRELKREETVRVIGRVFLGRDLQCAQCHNHPQIDDYYQRHYYGLAAFLKRSYLFTDPKSKQVMIGDKIEGDVTFTSVFTGEEGKTSPRMLELTELADPQPMEEPYEVVPDKTNRGVPKYNRRLQLGPAMVSDSNHAFRLNITNRIWAQMMGQGLVEPLDMFHQENIPSHPELLQTLADALRDHNYDLKYLLKEIAMSAAYQRTSYWEGAELPPLTSYLVGSIKPLSPEQFAWTLLQSLGEVQKQRALTVTALSKADGEFDPHSDASQNQIETAVTAALKPTIDKVVAVFASQNTASRFDASANHALFLINGPEIAALLLPGQGHLMDQLLACETPTEVADQIYLNVYSRLPTSSERKWVVTFIEASKEQKQIAVQELLRTLLCSAEFRFVR